MAELTIKADRKTWCLLAAIAGVALVIAAGVLSSVAMKTDSYDCGTFWASEDEWTYSSSYAGADSYFGSGIDSNDSVQAGVDDLMADLNTGANAFDICKDRHSDRAVLIYTLGGIGIALLVIAPGVAISGRRGRT